MTTEPFETAADTPPARVQGELNQTERNRAERNQAENRGNGSGGGVGGDRRTPRPRLHNRVQTVMVHVSRYSFQGRARLAQDVGVSRSTISRLINGQTSSSHALVQAVTDALSLHLKRPLTPRDLFSPDGRYPERSGCRLSGCAGCLPEDAFDGRGRRRAEWLNARPGDWSLADGAGDGEGGT